MRKIILDCDPGYDDAIAILMADASSNIDLLGITVVAGNQSIEKIAVNALNICSHFNIPTKVYRGQSAPLLRKQVLAGNVHGETGLDGITFEPHQLEIESIHAVNYIIETLKSAKEKITIVAIGPLTNIAMALSLDPSIKSNIEEIIIMGGACKIGNVTSAAEFNIYADPEAASIVFKSNCKIVMIGLDVTNKVKCLNEELSVFKDINNKSTHLFLQILKYYTEKLNFDYTTHTAALHDPATIGYLIDPSIFSIKKMHVDIDTNCDTKSYGRTHCDLWNRSNTSSNIYVATEVDENRFFKMLYNLLKDYK